MHVERGRYTRWVGHGALGSLRGWGKVGQAPAWLSLAPSLPSAGFIRAANVGATACEDTKSIWQGAERGERRRGCKSSELPPEQSNLGSERSRQRPETAGTPDCTACAAVSLASSSHRVRLLTSPAVTSHRLAARRPLAQGAAPRCRSSGAPLGGLCAPGRTRGSTNPLRNPTGPPAPQPRCPLTVGMGGRDAIASSCILGKRAWLRAGRAGRPGWTPPQTRAPPCQHRQQLCCSPETESRAPLLCRVSPLYLCLVIHL